MTATTPAFAELYDRSFGLVLRVLRRFGVAEAQLDDAAQDVFMTAYRKLPSFEGREAATTWIYAIARRVASDYRRASAARAARETVGGVDAAPTRTDPFADVAVAQASERLGQVLAELDERWREIFVLAELEGMS